MPTKLQKKSKNQPPANASHMIILVVPTKRRIRHLLREIISSGEAVTTAVPIFTLELFALGIWKVIYPGKRAVGEPILTLLFDQAVNFARNGLRYFYSRGERTQLPRGTFERVVHVIRKLKETGVYPERLQEELRQCELGEELKLADILAIYNGYERALVNLESVDPEGVFKMLSENCRHDEFAVAFRTLFPFATEVSINGFDEFTEPELDFISKLCIIDIDVTVVFDFQPGNIPLFGHLEENYKRFLELGFSVQTDTMPEHTSRLVEQMDLFSSPVTSAENNLQWIAGHLFKDSFPPSSRKHSPAITIVKAKDRRMEVELICKTIKQLIADNPRIDPSRVCVATYKPQTYTAIVREEFCKFGIPVNVTDRYELSESQVVVSIISVLELVTGGFRRDDLLRVLSSSYLVFAHEGTLLDRENLSRVSLQLRLTAGLRHWKKKIEQQIEATQSLSQQVTNAEKAGKRNTVRLNDLVRANDDLEHLESLLQNISMEQSPSAFEKHLLALLNKLDVVDRILSPGIGLHGDCVEKNSHAYDKFLSVVHQTIALLEYQRGKDVRHSLKFYLEQLKVAITEERYNVREQFGRGVLVTSIDETRGLPFDVMIVAGLVDGEFPSVYQSEIFFSSKRLKEREQHHIWENRYLFYQAVTNWTNHLYLTYPEQDADLDLVRSSFVDALENICEAERWEYPGNSPFEDAIYSRRDFLTHYGASLNLGGSAYLNVPEYLKEHVKDIDHSLAVEQSRVTMTGLPEYQGEIFNAISPESQELLAQLKNRVYSVSQLETYGKCPFQFFANRILRLNTVKDLEEEFSALDKGSVIHDILFEFYTELRENKFPLLSICSEQEFAQAHQRLLAIAERKLNDIDIPDTFWDLEKELLVGDQHTGRGLLRQYLDFERARSSTFLPSYFEVGFGNELGSQTRIDKTFSSEEPIVAGNVMLHGKVDRIEISDDAFAIIDYKTGSNIPKLDDIREGISLQLPIYLYTIEKLLAEKFSMELQPAAGMYYLLRNKIDLKTGVGSLDFKDDLGIKAKTGFLTSDADLRSLINESIKYVNKYVDEISLGRFPLTTHDKIDKVCTYCDYKTTCRIQTVRRVQQAKPEG